MLSGDQEWVQEWMDHLLDEDKDQYASPAHFNVKANLTRTDFAYNVICLAWIRKRKYLLRCLSGIWSTLKHPQILWQTASRKAD